MNWWTWCSRTHGCTSSVEPCRHSFKRCFHNWPTPWRTGFRKVRSKLGRHSPGMDAETLHVDKGAKTPFIYDKSWGGKLRLFHDVGGNLQSCFAFLCFFKSLFYNGVLFLWRLIVMSVDCRNFFQHLWLSEVWFRVAATTMTAGALALPSHCPSFLLQRTGPLGQRSMCLTLLRCTNDVSQPSSCPALEHSGRVIRWVKFRAIGNPLGLTFILQSVCISYLYFFHCFSSMSSMLSLSGYNFGNGFYNDHHFHYGYFVYSAAVPWSNLWWYFYALPTWSQALHGQCQYEKR